METVTKQKKKRKEATRGFYKAQVLCERRGKNLALWVMRVSEIPF